MVSADMHLLQEVHVDNLGIAPLLKELASFTTGSIWPLPVLDARLRSQSGVAPLAIWRETAQRAAD